MNKVLGLAVMLSAGSDAAFDVSTVMQSAINSVQGDLMKTLAIVVPALVLVSGAVTAVVFGLKWIKKMRSA